MDPSAAGELIDAPGPDAPKSLAWTASLGRTSWLTGIDELVRSSRDSTTA